MPLRHPRKRSTSDVPQPLPPSPPQRPSLQNRTYSAPNEAIPRLNRTVRRAESSFDAIREAEPACSVANDTDQSSHHRGSSLEDGATPRMPQVNLAVVGPKKAGKSTFVKCALDLKQTPTARSSVKKMSLDGTIYLVRLLEIGTHKIAFDEIGRVMWPQVLDEQPLPPIDGVLALFDSTDFRSFTQLSQILNSLRQSSNIPFQAVACKCDDGRHSFRYKPAQLEHVTHLLAGIDVLQTSTGVPESHKKCISSMLRAIIAQVSDVAREPQLASSRPRPMTSSTIASRQIPHPTRQHTRASSENPKSNAPDCDEGVASDSANTTNLALNAPGPRYVRSNSQPAPPRGPPGKRLNPGAGDTLPEESPADQASNRHLRTTWRHSAGSDAFSSFLDMEDEPDDSSQSANPPESFKSGSENAADTGVTFDELVGRLVSMPVTKQDANFPAIFLCLYRKFATPLQLLSAIIARFNEIENSETPQLNRHADQLSLLNVMTQWVSEYPGDFAGTKTCKKILSFIPFLERNMVCAFAAKEMASFLEKFVEDDDIDWAFNDSNDGSDSVETFLDTSVQSSPSTSAGQKADETVSNMSSLDLSDDNVDLSSQYSGTSSHARSGSISSQSIKTLMSMETAQRESQRLELTPSHMISKAQWRLFMEIPEEIFAQEVTRMDWIMYSSFRPRELIRHVSTSSKNKEKPSSHLKNVNRMIKAFNHLAYFVSSMVLFRDKARHRAETLEKFMSISLKLRQLYNYNSLGAVIAGLNKTPVYRLAQTRELVSPDIHKQFMSLIILMGTQKSHFAYRLAWDNSFAERIPFLPLHLRDLVSAEEGNKTFIGPDAERINWRKFEIMGDTVLGIQKSQKVPFPRFHRNDFVQRLVVEAKFGDDEEELYNRSFQVEPTATGAPEPKKRFGWRRN